MGIPSTAIPLDLFFFRCTSIFLEIPSRRTIMRIWDSSWPNRMISRSPASPVRLGGTAQICGLQNIRLPLGVVPVKDIGGGIQLYV